MERSLEGRTALVTGANGVLGSHFAQTLARAGAAVAVAARRIESLDRVIDAIADYQWLIFTSTNGVSAFARIWPGLCVASRALQSEM